MGESLAQAMDSLINSSATSLKRDCAGGAHRDWERRVRKHKEQACGARRARLLVAVRESRRELVEKESNRVLAARVLRKVISEAAAVAIPA